MEKRVLFNADAGFVLPDLSSDTDTPSVVETTSLSDSSADADVRPVELVIVDPATPNFEQLLADLNARDADYVVHVLDAERDGLTQISDLLAHYEGVAAVHIVSHGADGQLKLGSGEVTVESLWSKPDTVAAWSNALTDEADILFYGCDLASTADGQNFVETLAQLTGADVAASNDLTGHSSLGGDWDLEYSTGAVQAATLANEGIESQWMGVLSLSPTITDPGSEVVATDGSVVFSSANGNAIELTDDAGEPLTVTLSVSNGTLTLAGTTGLSFSAGADGSATMTFSGTLEDVNAALDGLLYQPDASYVGADALQINVADSQTEALDNLASLQAYYDFNAQGNLGKDESPSGGNDATLNGDASGVTNDPVRDEVVVLDGNNDYLEATGLTGSPTSVTLAGWVNLSSGSSNGSHLISLGDSVVLAVDRGQDSAGVQAFFYDGSDYLTTESGTFIAGTGWHHVAYVFDDVANTQTLYIDGAQVAQTSYTTSISYTQGSTTVIGSHGNGSGGYDVDGMIDDIRIYNDVLDAASITALTDVPPQPYVGSTVALTVQDTLLAVDDAATTATDTPIVIDVVANDIGIAPFTVVQVLQPTNGSVVDNGDGTVTYTPDAGFVGVDTFDYVVVDQGLGLSHYWSLDGTLSDSVGSSNGTLFGTTTVAGEFGSALGFNETSDYGQIPDVDYGSEFSITFDFKLDDNSGSLFQYLYSHGDINTTDSVNVFVSEASHGTDPNVLRTVIRDGDDTLDNAALQVDISALIGDGQWHTYSVTVDASGISVFIDGVLVASDATRGTDGVNPAGDLLLGARYDLNADRYYGGSLDSLQIFDRALTTSEVSSLDSLVQRASVAVTVEDVNEAPVNSVPGDQSVRQDGTLVFSESTGNAITLTDDSGDADIELTLSVNDGTLSLSAIAAVTTEASANNTTSGFQRYSDVAMADDGSYVVVWESQSEGDGYGVYAQRFDAAGNALGAETLVNTYTTGDQDSAAVAMSATGEFVVVWESTDQDGSNTGIYAQRFDASGTKVGAEFRVNTTTTGQQAYPEVAMDAAGNFVVLFIMNDGGGNGVFIQRFDSAGNALGGEVRVNSFTSGTQMYASLDMNDSGAFVVTWGSFGQDGDNMGVYAQRYDATGTAVGGEIQVNTTTAGAQTTPDVGIDAAGNFVVAWVDSSELDGDSAGIFAQRFDSSGVALGSETLVNTSTDGAQNRVRVAMQDDGSYMIVWQGDQQDGSIYDDTFAQAYDAAGNALGVETALSGNGGSSQWAPAIAASGDGSYLLSWSGSVPGDGVGVSHQLFDVPDVTFVSGDGVDDGSLTVRGTLRELNGLLAGMMYTPDPGYSGTDTLTVTVDDLGNTGSGGALQDTDTVLINVLPNAAPDITSDGGLAAGAVNVNENETAVTTVVASDADGDAVTYSIVGGADAGAFLIDPVTGVLAFAVAPDFELPADNNGDNVYEVIVQADDGFGGLDTQTLSVAVQDVGLNLTVTTTDDVVDGDTSSVEALVANMGADGFISLREAIIATNNDPGAETIYLPSGTYTLGIGGTGEDFAATGDLDVRDDLTVVGAGAGTTVIDGNSLDRVLSVEAGLLVMSGVTITGGNTAGADDGAGIFVNNSGALDLQQSVVTGNTTADSGGGLNVFGTLTLTDVTISNNTGDLGGGINISSADVTMNRVTISGNNASFGGGVRVFGAGTNATLTNVTISGNVATNSGGGISNNTDLTLTNVTITLNSAVTGAGLDEQTGGTRTYISNSIVAGNIGDDVVSDAFDSQGHNIIGNAGGSSGWTGTDQLGVTPDLGGLQDNGGFTETHALLAGSAGIDEGDDGLAPASDQRGEARVGTSDIGAYEYVPGSNAPSDIVFDSESSSEQVVNATTSGNQLQAAVAEFADGGYIVVWISNTTGTNDVIAQRFNADGTANGSEFVVTSEVADNETQPSVTTFSDGGFAIAWQDQQSGVRAWTEMRIFDASGTAVTSDIVVSTGIDGDNEAYQPAIIALSDTEFAVVYANEVGASTYEIRGQRYDRTGSTVGSEFVVGSLAGPSGLFGAQVETALLDDGGFAVTWRSYDGATFETRLRIMNADGTQRSAEILVGGDNIADVAVLADGNVVVTYDDAGSLKAAIYDASGALVVAEFDVNTTVSANRYESSVTGSDDGFVVVWESSAGDGSGRAILAQRFAADGTKIGGEVLVNTFVSGDQRWPEVITLASGEVLAVWESDGSDGNQFGIASRVIATGTASVVEGAANGTRVADVIGVVDSDPGDTHTFTLVDDAGGRFAIDAVTGVVTVADGTLLNYLLNTSHSITVRVTDSSGFSYDEALVIEVLSSTSGTVAVDDPGDYSALVAAFNPVSSWQLDEFAGTSATDSGSATNDGTYVGGVLGASGAIAGSSNTALSFDGINDRIEIADDPAYQLSDGTVQLWFNADNTGTFQSLFSKDASTNDAGHFGLFIDSAGIVTLQVQDGTQTIQLTSAAPISWNEWHHVAVSFGSDGLQLYVDGELVDSDVSYTDGWIGNSEPIAIGMSTGGSTPGQTTPGSSFFSGTMDEVAIFGSQLGAASIGALYHAGITDYGVAEGDILSVDAASGVLANDWDAEGDPLTATLISGPSSAASFTLNADGSFTYVHDGGETTTDSFIYEVSDGNGNTDQATVTIRITGVNDNPEITSDGGGDSVTLNHNENQTLVTTVTSSDPDGACPPTQSLVGRINPDLRSMP